MNTVEMHWYSAEINQEEIETCFIIAINCHRTINAFPRGTIDLCDGAGVGMGPNVRIRWYMESEIAYLEFACKWTWHHDCKQ